MTKEEILNMPTGREMDALVDVHCFGREVTWRECQREPECGELEVDPWTKHSEYWPIEKHPCWKNEYGYWRVVPFRSTDISAASGVWEKIKEDKKLWGNFLRALFDVTDNDVLYRLNPEIICRAALLAVMEDK